MKRFIALIIQSLIVFVVSAQINKYGTPVTKSYSMQLTKGAEYNWCITKDKFGAVYFANDDNLVIRYDGSKWSTIPLNQNEPTIVRSLGTDENGIIYVGGINEFGYIEPDSSGKRVYVSMSARISSAKDVTFIDPNKSLDAKNALKSDLIIGDIKSLAVKNSTIYFLSPSALIIYKSDIDSLEYINLRKLGYRNCERLFYINDKIILTSNNTGLYELKKGRLVQLAGGDFFSKKICLSLLSYNKDQLIVGTLNTGIYLYNYSDGTVDSSFLDRGMFNKLKELYVYCGVRLQTGEIIFGTTTDGLYVFDGNGRYIGHWSSENTNMLDNAIRALYTDPNSNSELWISTSGFISKAYTNLPFTQFSEKDGLDGSVNNFCVFNGSIYVATDKGLFKSIIEKDGTRRFVNFNNITSEIFPLCVSTVAKDSFLLAGSAFDGFLMISSSGKSVSLSIISDPTRIILQSKLKKNRFYVGKTNAFIDVLEYNSGIWKNVGQVKGLSGEPAYMNELENGDLLILTERREGLFRLPFNDTIPVKYSSEKGMPVAGLNCLNECRGEFYLTTSAGIFKLNKENDKWSSCDDITGGYTKNKNIDYYYIDTDGDIWISSNEERYYDIMFTNEMGSVVMKKAGALSILPNLKFQNTSSLDGCVWLAKSKSIFIINKEKLNAPLPSVQTLLTKIIVSSHRVDSLVMNETFYRKSENGRRYPSISNIGEKLPEFNYTLNSPSFYWTTPCMIQEEDIIYSYKLEGFDDEWSKWDKILYKNYTNLPFGKYTFKLKARTATEIESKEASYSFIILKPWYFTPLMIIMYTIVFVFIIFVIIKAYTRKLKNENIRLENIVTERTSEVIAQKKIIEEKNRKITESIHYSKHIQDSILIKQDEIDKIIPGSFVYMKPKDIVSGDFYWFYRYGDFSVIAAIDCTGHGVPGAFMCMISNMLLNFIVKEKGIIKPSEILNNLNSEVIKVLQQERKDSLSQDGMDISVCTIDIKNGMMQYAGAKNPLFIVINSDLNIIEADPFSIGGTHLLRNNTRHIDFKNQEIKLMPGSSVYLFTDGYVDQFGGPDNKSFNMTRFSELVKSISKLHPAEQYRMLDSTINEWMNSTRQIDDMLVIGIKL